MKFAECSDRWVTIKLISWEILQVIPGVLFWKSLKLNSWKKSGNQGIKMGVIFWVIFTWERTHIKFPE